MRSTVDGSIFRLARRFLSAFRSVGVDAKQRGILWFYIRLDTLLKGNERSQSHLRPGKPRKYDRLGR